MLKVGNRAAAINDLRKIIDIGPQSDDLYVRTVKSITKGGFYNEGLAIINRLIAKNIKNANLFVGRGIARQNLGDINGAMLDYNTALKLDTASSDAYSNRGSAKLGLQDYEGALADVARAIKIHEGEAEPYLIRAKIRMATKDYQGAVDDYNSVLFIDLDNNNIVFAQRGFARSFLQDTERMHTDFAYALKYEPKNSEIFYLRAKAKINLKDITGACADFNQAISLGSKAAIEEAKRFCR